MNFIAGNYDIVVIGAGHAGCEAALACARMGYKTVIFSISLDGIALMACNPAIGGTSKGHLVREIDALGGEMGKVIDKTFIQIKMLNTAKGPAVHSLRAQADKRDYQTEMKKILENQENLDVKQGEITKINVEFDKVVSVQASTGEVYTCSSAIVCSGVYLGGKIIIGEYSQKSGPSGLFPANELTASLIETGHEIMRFKTGTPARVDKRTLDLSKMTIQEGHDKISPFSFTNDVIDRQQSPCYLTYTNEKTHEIIRKNIHRSPLYGGLIDGIGPRYCPSIEDKVMKFPHKQNHQVFVEPEGLDTNEMYIQGMSSSLPIDVQIRMYRTVPGMEKVEFMRPAYAIEYDCINSTQLKLSLESRKVKGLFFAGQVNGSSGYEEAAAQGLLAGINAGHFLKNCDPIILDRSQAYIGVLIDDLVTKGTNEPYRMMTSRAEYRLLLRQDNADIRLTEIGYKVGLISDDRYKNFIKKKNQIENEIRKLKTYNISPNSTLSKMAEEKGTTNINTGITAYNLLKRPEFKIKDLKILMGNEYNKYLSRQEEEQIEVNIKYEGYIKKQIKQAEQFKKIENKRIPDNIDYFSLEGLRLEARQKLDKQKPEFLGQASRISGVSPADITVLLIYLDKLRREKNE